MGTLDPAVMIVMALALLPMIWLVVVANKLTRLKNLIAESWSNVEVALKRRYDLIPNLVETAKGYAKHEAEVLESVLATRSLAMAATGPAGQQAHEETAMVRMVNKLLAVVESYPQLKASEQFLSVQKELASTEDRIAAARRFFNANVREFNTMVESIPSSWVASWFAYKPESYFEVDSLVFTVPSFSG